jgi:hypothetical protein
LLCRVRSPDQGLVCPCRDLDCFGGVAVPGDPAQLVAAGAHHVGEAVRVAGVALGARDRVPLPVAGQLQRVDRVHLVAGGDQGLDPRPPVGLDPDHDLTRLGVLGQVPPDELVQPAHASHAFREPGRAEPAAGLVLDLHVVVVLGPVVAHE